MSVTWYELSSKGKKVLLESLTRKTSTLTRPEVRFLTQFLRSRDSKDYLTASHFRRVNEYELEEDSKLFEKLWSEGYLDDVSKVESIVRDLSKEHPEVQELLDNLYRQLPEERREK